MTLFKKYDMQSIYEALDKMIDFDYKRYDPHSEYYDEYEDQINEMACFAGDMYNELERIRNEIYFKMPFKKIEFFSEDECSQTAIAWWNTSVAFLYDTDMHELLESENKYFADGFSEKQKRINAFTKLTKEQQLFMFSTVTCFITRFQELQSAFDTIEGVVSELDRHQAMRQANKGAELPYAAYIA